MKVLDLFSGIGGFSLGLERAGMETVAFCEFDEKCRQVLTKHWPDVPQYNDVRELTAEQLKNDGITNIGLICGGYPCQPFSVAGNRAGEKDDRHLWPEIERLLAEFIDRGEPITWCLFENVTGHISMGLDIVLADLETLGYTCWPLVIPACAVGAYHRRDRVWILAHAESKRRGETGKSSARRSVGATGASSTPEDVADTNIAGCEECNTATQPDEPGSFARGSDAGGCSWNPEPAVGRVANGVQGRVDRLKQLGNAVVHQVVEMIGRAIMDAEAAQIIEDRPSELNRVREIADD